jgi:Dolichyl-phosphate-mannose-protein mannosyltransferase
MTRLREHWMIIVLLLLGAALRGVTEAAYWPALIFPDSVRYLEYAYNFVHGHWTVDDQRQSGYSILITPAVALNAIWLIPLVQHVAGLATAVLIYAVLIRFGARRWLAAVATIPVLFDPLQVILEQYVLTDIWTVLLVMAALAILVWRRGGPTRDGPTWRGIALAGLLLGLAVTFRDEELIMIIPAVIYLIVVTRSWRKVLALAACFLIPVGAYLGWFQASHGKLGFTTFSGAFLYGRVADFADCTGLTLPAYEKPLCPTQPPAQRVADYYTWNPASPQWTFSVPPGKTRDAVVQDFSLRILEHQPLAYAAAVGRDFLYGFSPVRGAGPEHYSPSYLQFHRQIPPDPQATASLKAIGIGWPASNPALAGFLAGYWFYVPGPLLAAGLVVGLAGAVSRRQKQAIQKQAMLFGISAIAVLIPAAAFATFDWRYQLPQLTLIPVAAVLGITALGVKALTATAGTARSDRPASAAEHLQEPPSARSA